MLRRLPFLLAVSPTLVAIFYYGFVATGRYVSEVQFVVRTASKPVGAAGLGALLQMSGLGRAQDEVFAVQSFMTSRNAVEQLIERLPMRKMYGHPDADWFARYPSVIYGNTNEEFHRYLSWMIRPVYGTTTGITTLRVQAFTAEDARQVAAQLLDLSEHTVNEMNERIQRESVRMAEAEVKRHEERLIGAQQAITRFRNSELMIDPAGSSIVITELIGRLSGELSQTEAQIREVSTVSGSNPQLQSLRARAEAQTLQIARERARISNDKEGLAKKLEVYERLVLDREFAKQSLETAVRSLEASQGEARRQQLYIERIVNPVAADLAIAPQRLRMILSTAGLNLCVGVALWLVVAGWREHAAEV